MHRMAAVREQSYQKNTVYRNSDKNKMSRNNYRYIIAAINLQEICMFAQELTHAKDII